MAKELEPVEVGTISPVRRVRSVSIQSYLDQSVTPARDRLAATFEYEIAYTDAEGNVLLPAKHDGYVSLNDAQCRALPDFMSAFGTLSAVGDALKDQQTQPAEPTPA